MIHSAPVGVLRVTRTSYPLELKERWPRYDHILSSIDLWIKSIRAQRPDQEIRVAIEHYALHMKDSSSVSGLCELGGLMRMCLWRNKWPFVEVSPSAAKKFFTQNGKANKAEMYVSFEQKGFRGLPELLRCMTHQNPVEDIVDAVAILQLLASGGLDGPPKDKKKKKKRAQMTLMSPLSSEDKPVKRRKSQ